MQNHFLGNNYTVGNKTPAYVSLRNMQRAGDSSDGPASMNLQGMNHIAVSFEGLSSTSLASLRIENILKTHFLKGFGQVIVYRARIWVTGLDILYSIHN